MAKYRGTFEVEFDDGQRDCSYCPLSYLSYDEMGCQHPNGPENLFYDFYSDWPFSRLVPTKSEKNRIADWCLCPLELIDEKS